MPSEIRPQRDWRTRSNPFEEVWPEIEALIRDEPRLKAKTIFEERGAVAALPGEDRELTARVLVHELREVLSS